MRIWILVLCLSAFSLLIHAQDTCSCSSQLTQIQMQMQLDRDNLNYQLIQQANITATANAKAKLDIKAMMDEDFSQHDKNMIAESNRIIDQVLLRVIIALFATAGWGFSLAMVIIYWRL